MSDLRKMSDASIRATIETMVNFGEPRKALTLELCRRLTEARVKLAETQRRLDGLYEFVRDHFLYRSVPVRAGLHGVEYHMEVYEIVQCALDAASAPATEKEKDDAKDARRNQGVVTRV